MTGKLPKINEQIRELRSSLRLTPSQLAEALGVSTGRVSEWEGGVRAPSLQGLIKLGALAAKSDPAEALFFWEQTGLDPKLIVSLVNALLRTGQVDAGPLLQTVEAIWKQRLGDAKELKDEGKVVLVPPYGKGVWGEDQSHLPQLPVPTEKVANVASTFYLIAYDPNAQERNGRFPPWITIHGKPRTSPFAAGLRRGFAEGDSIVFDTLGASARKFGPFLDHVVLVDFTERASSPHGAGAWPSGLFVGRLALMVERDSTWVVIAPHEESHPESVDPDRVQIASFQHEDYMEEEQLKSLAARRAVLRRATAEKQTEIMRESHAAYSRASAAALSEIAVPEGCEIMGRFIALFSGESGGAGQGE